MPSPLSKIQEQSAVRKAAFAAIAAGVSVIPIRADGSKEPALATWIPYQREIASAEQIGKWFPVGDVYPVFGLAVVGGAVSGNLECLDFDDKDVAKEFNQVCRDNSIGEIIEKLKVVTATPSGGHHAWFRCAASAGTNTRLAWKLVDSEEGAAGARFIEGKWRKRKILIETRGEGGYALVPPSPAACHPDGRSYRFVRGGWDSLPTLTEEERDALHQLASLLNEWVDPETVAAPRKPRADLSAGEGLRPGDDYNLRGDYTALLEKHGWTQVKERGEKGLWRRPGKAGRGWSATSNYAGSGYFYAFSSNCAPFRPNESYSPLGVYAELEHGGDFAAAAKDLAKQGYGSGSGSAPKKKQRSSNSSESDPPTPAFRNGKDSSAPAGNPAQQDQTADAEAVELPVIETNNVPFEAMCSETLAALLGANLLSEGADNPAEQQRMLFVRSGILQWVTVNERHRAVAKPVGKDELRHRVSKTMRFVSTSHDRGTVNIAPKASVMEDLLARQSYNEFPALETIVTAPILAPDGTITTRTGYSRSARTFYHAPGEVAIGDISATAKNLAAARALLIDDYLGEFPFADQASRAHAVALMILPFVRQVISGPTPLHLIDAPTEGTGKGLLSDIVTMVFSPDGAAVAAEVGDEAEWSKTITSQLQDAPSHILIDNVNRPLRSASLNAVLTSSIWRGRILGQSTMAQLPNRAVWMATGNNPEMNAEIARRTLLIHLDAGLENPSQRTGFRRPDLRCDVRENRSALVTAVLTMIAVWQSLGRPRYTKRKMGSFEEWSNVIGGILQASGVAGFLENMENLREKADVESDAWSGFVAEWWTTFGEQEVGTDKLFPIAEAHLSETLRFKESDRGSKTSFGIALRKRIDKVFAGHKITTVKSLRNGALYQLRAEGLATLLSSEIAGNLENLGNLPQPHRNCLQEYTDTDARDSLDTSEIGSQSSQGSRQQPVFNNAEVVHPDIDTPTSSKPLGRWDLDDE